MHLIAYQGEGERERGRGIQEIPRTWGAHGARQQFGVASLNPSSNAASIRSAST
jgi:hypothetical protein